MSRLLRMDALHLLRDRLAVAILAAGLLTALVAALTGTAWQQRLLDEAASVGTEADGYRVGERTAWASATPASAPTLPGRLITTLVLPTPAMADFTAGRSAIEPAAAQVRMATRPDALFVRYQVENPERLARGALDLSFIAIVVAPLLLIGLGYGVFIADRDSGAARLWLAQAGSPLRLLAARSVTRLSLVAAPILLAGGLLWLLGPAGRGADILAWLGVALIALLFWWAVILLVNSFRIAAETAAFALIGLWTLLVFVTPVAIGAASAAINPPPSRIESITAARSAEIRAIREDADDHPEISPTSPEARRIAVRRGMEVRRAVAGAVAPHLAESRAQFDAQRRLGGQLALLSPPLLASEAMAAIAGTDAASYAGQREAAAGFVPRLGAALAASALGEQPVDAAAFDALPRFEPPPTLTPSPLPIAWIILVTILLATWALARLRRATPL